MPAAGFLPTSPWHEPNLMTSCPSVEWKVSEGERVSAVTLGDLPCLRLSLASALCPLEVYSPINRTVPNPGMEPAAINKHEVNKVADAGAWDKTETLPVFA